MLLKLSNLNSNLALTRGYLNPVLNNSAQAISLTGIWRHKPYKHGGKWGSITIAGLEKQLPWEIGKKFLRFIQICPVWSNPRESWILDYTLWIPNSCQCNLNSRFQSLALFRILWVEFRIPKSASNNFPDLDSGIPYMERPSAAQKKSICETLEDTSSPLANSFAQEFWRLLVCTDVVFKTLFIPGKRCGMDGWREKSTQWRTFQVNSVLWYFVTSFKTLYLIKNP